jgi:hypothetical protein
MRDDIDPALQVCPTGRDGARRGGGVGQLNARKVATANGGRSRHMQVRQILGQAVTATYGRPIRDALKSVIARS